MRRPARSPPSTHLVLRYQDAAYSLALRFLGSREAAEDATQEAMIRAYDAIRSFRGERFRSWLLSILANVARDELRRLRRRPQRSLDEARDDPDTPSIEPPDLGPSPEAEALRGELRRALERALLQLPEEWRLIVILSDVHGLAYEEIADTFRPPARHCEVAVEPRPRTAARYPARLRGTAGPLRSSGRQAMMRIWWRLTVWRRALGRGARGDPAPGEAEERDRRLSAYLDGDWSAAETPALQSQLAGDPDLRSALGGMRQVRDALARMGEVRAPRPFTLEAAPAPPRASRPELATRIGAATAAVLLAAVLIGDVATTGNGRDTLTEAPAAARAELASAPAAEPEAAGEAADGAPATPTVPALAAPTPQPEPAGESADAASAPVEKTLAPPEAAAPTGTEQEAAAIADGGGALRALEIALLAAMVALAAAAAGQWGLRRRG